MPVNPGLEYQKAERKYAEARTIQEKLTALNEMIRTVPKHKSSESLQAEIKGKIAKYKTLSEKEKQAKRGKSKFSIKKEGAATIVLIGTTNSGKSTLLNRLTNKNVEVASYPFTTKNPEIATMDYKGVKLQLIEIPAIVKNFYQTQNGPAFLSIIRMADLILLLYKKREEMNLVLNELEGIGVNILEYKNQENIRDLIWKELGLIKVYTKSLGKDKDFPPVAMKKDSTIKDLAFHIHKDFVRKFRFARVWGKSVKFDGSQVSLNHILKDEDVVELHLK